MVNILIATNDINIIKRLTNEIITNNHDIRIAKISNSNQETIDMLNNTNIDIMFCCPTISSKKIVFYAIFFAHSDLTVSRKASACDR